MNCQYYTDKQGLVRSVDDLVNSHEKLVAALKGLFEHCAMVHKHWGDGSNQKDADTAIATASAALAEVENVD